MLGALLAGGLTALAQVLQQVMTPAVVAAMTAVGGVLVIAIGLRLLGLARIRVANLLPAVLLAPLATGVVAAVWPSRRPDRASGIEPQVDAPPVVGSRPR